MANTRGTRSDAGHGHQDHGGNRGDDAAGNRNGDESRRHHSDRDRSPRGSERGFAAMDAERQREIASMGGRAAHRRGTAHEFDSEEARAAGRRGGEVVSQNRQHMAAIGALGGRASRGGGARAGASAVLPATVVQPNSSARPPGTGAELGVGLDEDRQDNGSGTQGSNSRH